MHACTHAYMHVCLHACTHTTHTHADYMHTHTHTHTTCTHTHTTHTHTTHIHTHTHTPHTHTQSQWRAWSGESSKMIQEMLLHPPFAPNVFCVCWLWCSAQHASTSGVTCMMRCTACQYIWCYMHDVVHSMPVHLVLHAWCSAQHACTSCVTWCSVQHACTSCYRVWCRASLYICCYMYGVTHSRPVHLVLHAWCSAQHACTSGVTCMM